MEKSLASVLNELGKLKVRYQSDGLKKKHCRSSLPAYEMSWKISCKSREENVFVVQIKYSGCQATSTHITPLASPPDLQTSFLAKLPE